MKTKAPPNIFAAGRRLRIRERALARMVHNNSARYLHEAMAEDIIERLSFMRFTPKTVLIIGDLSGIMEDALRHYAPEIVCKSPRHMAEDQPYEGAPYDLVINLISIASVNDVPGAILMMRAALAEGGIAIASFAGAGSLMKLRQICLAADGDAPAARMHPMIDERAAASLMERTGFRRQVVDGWPINIRYSSLMGLVSDLRDMGLGNALSNAPPAVGKAWLARAKAEFARLSDDEGKLEERFSMLTLTGWR